MKKIIGLLGMVIATNSCFAHGSNYHEPLDNRIEVFTAITPSDTNLIGFTASKSVSSRFFAKAHHRSFTSDNKLYFPFSYSEMVAGYRSYPRQGLSGLIELGYFKTKLEHLFGQQNTDGVLTRIGLEYMPEVLKNKWRFALTFNEKRGQLHPLGRAQFRVNYAATKSLSLLLFLNDNDEKKEGLSSTLGMGFAYNY